MGYSTRYKLKIRKPEPGIDTRPVWQEPIEGGITLRDACGPDCESWSWYSHEEDMRRISRKYPTLVFELDGDGEEQGDTWRCYFRDGRMQEWTMPKIKPDAFDPNKLDGGQ